MPRTKKEDWTGIYKHYTGRDKKTWCWRAVVSGGGRKEKRIRKWFHRTTSLKVMQDWRRDTQARLRLERKLSGARTRGTFAADVTRYLKHPNVTRLLDYDAREFEITRWLPFFGTKATAEISANDIRAVMEHWATAPRSRQGKPGRTPLSRGRVNKFLTALKHLGRTLYGRRAVWGAVDVELFDPSEQPLRSLSEDERVRLRRTLLTFVAHEAERYRAKSPQGAKVDALIHTTRQYVARLRTLFETGMPSGYLRILSADHIDVSERVIYRPRRRKGAGADASPLALSLDAVDAVTELLACDALGDFNAHTLSRVLNRAAKAAGIQRPIRPHDLRHTILDELVGVTGDEGAVADFAQHTNTKTTRKIYTRRSIPPRVRAAVNALDASRGRKSGDNGGDNQGPTKAADSGALRTTVNQQKHVDTE